MFVLFVVIGIYFPIFAQQKDTLMTRRGESGKNRIYTICNG